MFLCDVTELIVNHLTRIMVLHHWLSRLPGQSGLHCSDEKTTIPLKEHHRIDISSISASHSIKDDSREILNRILKTFALDPFKNCNVSSRIIMSAKRTYFA